MSAELNVVAWMDDGTHLADESGGPLVRVVTDKTRSRMPWRAVAAYEEPLVTLASAKERIEALEAAFRQIVAACNDTSLTSNGVCLSVYKTAVDALTQNQKEEKR